MQAEVYVQLLLDTKQKHKDNEVIEVKNERDRLVDVSNQLYK